MEGIGSGLATNDMYNVKDIDVKEAISAIVDNITSMKVLPKICDGDHCENKDYCPLYKMNKAPVGKFCPIEEELIAKLRYMFEEELGIEPTSVSERMLLNDLIETHLYDVWRTNGPMMTKGVLVKVPAIVNEKTGNVYYKDAPNPMFKIKEELKKKKIEILKEFVATRKQKLSLKTRNNIDPSTFMVEIIKIADKEIESEVENTDAIEFKKYKALANKNRKFLLERLGYDPEKYDEEVKNEIDNSQVIEEQESRYPSARMANVSIFIEAVKQYIDFGESEEFLLLLEENTNIRRFIRKLMELSDNIRPVRDNKKLRGKPINLEYKSTGNNKYMNIKIKYDPSSFSGEDIAYKLLKFRESNKNLLERLERKFVINLIPSPVRAEEQQSLMERSDV